LLAARYKLDQSKIIQQIHEQWRELRISSVKSKVESWVTEWKNLRLTRRNGVGWTHINPQ
jgi:hypothetical protein